MSETSTALNPFDPYNPFTGQTIFSAGGGNVGGTNHPAPKPQTTLLAKDPQAKFNAGGGQIADPTAGRVQEKTPAMLAVEAQIAEERKMRGMSFTGGQGASDYATASSVLLGS